MNKRVQSVAITRPRSLLKLLKRLMGLWEPGSESGLPCFRMGAEGKYPNLRIWLKSWVSLMRGLRERFRIIVAEVPSVPVADLILRDWIRRRISYGFVSWASGTCGWGDENICWRCDLPCVHGWLYRRVSWDDGSVRSVVLGVRLYQQNCRPALCG